MHSYTRRINYYETDKMGITHHSNYVRFMEEARIDYLEQIGVSYGQMEKDGVISPVIGIECEYKRPTTFADELIIHVEIEEYKKLKLTVSYRMINARTGELVFTGKSFHCFISSQGRPVALAAQHPDYDRALRSAVKEG